MIKLVMIKDEFDKMFATALDNELKVNTDIIVENDKGINYVTTVSDVKEYNDNDVPKEICSFIRVATDKDKKIYENLKKDAKRAILDANKIKDKLNLNMSIIDAKYSFDKKQLLFIFTAEGRIDFRDMVKELAQLYKVRIELRQIGVRDKAKKIGGIGPCGRFLCCSTFLNDFNSVSINMAKNQYIALNPTKINGVCGRLLCCLKYEDDQYTEMKKDLPKIGSRVNINGVEGKINSINIFLNTAIIETKNKVFVEVDLGDYNGSNK